MHFERETEVPLPNGQHRRSPVLCGQYARQEARLLRTTRPWQVSCHGCHKELLAQSIPGAPAQPNPAGLPLGAAIHPDRAAALEAVVEARRLLEARLRLLEQLDGVRHAPDCQRRGAPGLVSFAMTAGGSLEATAGLRELLALEARTCSGCVLVERTLAFVAARDRGEPGRAEWSRVLEARREGGVWST